MHMDPVMPQAVGAILLILLIGLGIKLLKQPHVVAYLIAGVIIGPAVLGIVDDYALIGRLGAIGVVLLLFFVGMETEPQKLVDNWKLAIFGTLIQIGLSVACTYAVGWFLDWTFARALLLGFVISLSSTAVIIKLLSDNAMLDTKVGKGVLSILLAQDLAIIPMLICIGLMTSSSFDVMHMLKQLAGAALFACAFLYIVKKKVLHFPLGKWLNEDKELQLFTALTVCFGLALLTGWFDLSTALGAFLAGLIIGAAKETQWVHHTMEPLKVLFLALFFVSIGMLLDLEYLKNNFWLCLMLVFATFITNTFINAAILHVSDFTWKESLHAGVLLAQIGEFSFVLAAVGLTAGLIVDSGYQLALCVISLSLLFSPMWIGAGEKLLSVTNKGNK